jgi:cytochrome subunit of sulfide dehydrogenase
MKYFSRYIPIVLLSLGAGTAQADISHIRSMAASCAACHGTNGVAEPGMESLAGKSKDDIQKKMLDYKSGKKPATIMHQLAKGYSDEQIEQLASYFAALKK